MKDVVEELGFDGMSSDDTDIEDYQPIYWARNLPWRWQGVTSILDIIDQERTLPGQGNFEASGSVPRKRIRDGSDVISSDRKAPRGLPERLYDAEWLTSLPHRCLAALSVSKENFKWMKVMVDAA